MLNEKKLAEFIENEKKLMQDIDNIKNDRDSKIMEY